MGCYGPQAAPVDQNLLDRVKNLPQAKDYLNWEIPRPSLEELRREYGFGVSDDELLLKILCQNQDDIKAMHTAGPNKTYYPIVQKPLMVLIQDLVTRRKPAQIYFKKGELSLTDNVQDIVDKFDVQDIVDYP